MASTITTSNPEIEPSKPENIESSDPNQQQPASQLKLDPNQPVSILSRAPSPFCPSPVVQTAPLSTDSTIDGLLTTNKTKFVHQTSPRLGPVVINPTIAQGGGLLLQDLAVVNQSGLVKDANGINKAWKADKRRATPYPKLEEGDHYEFDGSESQNQDDSEDTQEDGENEEDEDEDEEQPRKLKNHNN